MSYFKDIQTALDTRLDSLDGGVSIAWDNTKFIPIKGTPYMRPTVLMSPAVLGSLETLQMNNGIYQIDLFYPTDVGSGDVLTQADAVFDHFKANLKLDSGSVSVYIKEISRLSRDIPEQSWYMTSIEVHFKTYNN